MMQDVKTLVSALTGNAIQRGKSIAMRDEQTVLTWSEVAERAGSIAALLPAGPIGIFGSNCCDWALTYLACLISGRTIVPLPTFFSEEQRNHILRTAKVSAIVAISDYPDAISTVPVLKFSALIASSNRTVLPPDVSRSATDALIAFTSGSTGQPKGVRLTLSNIMATAEALKEAVRITEIDKYLSVMPLAMLLEQVCAIIIPVLAGAAVEFCKDISDRAISGQRIDLAAKIVDAKPTIMVLVPQLLRLLTAQASLQTSFRTSDSLRFIAVGGACTGSSALKAARDAGLPVYEGYGLTECTSVVALNTPEHDHPGSVGKPLSGIQIDIVDGEIVVSGPNVMSGYLGAGQEIGHRWATGDVGEILADSSLIVRGRKDNLIVCSNGRNVSPEWVETALQSAGGVLAAIVCPSETGNGLAALVVANWPRGSQAAQLAKLSSELSAKLPAYAVPNQLRAITPEDANAAGLFRMGKPNRVVGQSLLQTPITDTQEVLSHEPV